RPAQHRKLVGKACVAGDVFGTVPQVRARQERQLLEWVRGGEHRGGIQERPGRQSSKQGDSLSIGSAFVNERDAQLLSIRAIGLDERRLALDLLPEAVQRGGVAGLQILPEGAQAR